MRKKGMFFIFIALFMTILIVAVVSTTQSFRYRERSESISKRVDTMNGFIEDFDKDFERAVYIGGYRSLLSVYSYMRTSQGYVDLDQIFTEVLQNGTANGTAMDLMMQDGQGASLDRWLERINEEASKLNMQVSMDVNDIYLTQLTPWEILISVDADVSIDDVKGLARWDYNKVYSKSIPILGFEDPIYLVETEDKVSNLINRTPYTQFVASGDTTSLADHLARSYYIATNGSPSFLMRFEGNLSPSSYGIESMVNLEDLSLQNYPILPRSVIDHIYFGNQTTTDYCNVTGMPSWFRIDDSHISGYDLDSQNMTTC